MRDRLFPLVLLCLTCAFAAIGQTVDEKRSSAQIVNGSVEVILAVDGQTSGGVNTSLQLVDTWGKTVSELNGEQQISRGRQFLKFVLSSNDITDSVKNDYEYLPWYRLNYNIGGNRGTISLTQMINEIFELRVTASSQTFAGNIYRARVRAFQPYTQAPASGVSIEGKLELEIKHADEDTLELSSKALTVADGIAVLEFKIPADVQMDYDAKLSVIGRRNGLVREVSDDIDTLESRRDFLMLTDKSLYQPEQTLNVRGIMLDGRDAKTVAAGREIEIRIEDESNTVLYRERLKTSDFGVAFLSWQIPANAKLGNYYIEVKDEFGEEIGRQSVKVSRYDLPNFVVKTKTDKTFYLPEDDFAEIDITADYLFGKPVTKGTVRVVEEKERRWNWSEQKYDISEGEKFEGETDAEGKFTAKIPLSKVSAALKNNKWSKYEDINFAAYFTDPTTNKTEQRRFDLRVSREPIHLYFIYSRNEPHPKFPYVGYVNASYADGTPARVTISVNEENSDVDDDDDDQSKSKKGRLLATASTNIYGVSKFSFTKPKDHDTDDELGLIITAKDSDGKTGTLEREIEFEDLDETAVKIESSAAIYKPGEPIDLSLMSTEQSGTVQVDILLGQTVLSSHTVEISGGRGRLMVPYSDQFAGEISVAAYIEPASDEDDDDLPRDVRQVIYPAKNSLDISVGFDKEIYKPGEDAKLTFGVTGPSGKMAESAIGVAIVDTAVEHRARTDSEFGSRFGGFSGWLGYGSAIGGVNIKDIRDLDTTKPISADLQLTAEALLAQTYYSPKVFFSDNYLSDAKYVFGSHFKPQAKLLSEALKKNYTAPNYEYPTDHASLVNILRKQSVEYDLLRDPWGERYRSEFGYEKEHAIVRLYSNGQDKTAGTRDDFEIFTEKFSYFSLLKNEIETTLLSHYANSQELINDREKLLKLIGRNELNDIYGHPYEIDFFGNGRLYTIRIRSVGKNGKREFYPNRYSTYFYSYGDDFELWTGSFDYFAKTAKMIEQSQSELKVKPKTEAEFRATLLAADIDVDALRDSNGKPLFITTRMSTVYGDRIATERVRPYGAETFVERKVRVPVTQEIVTFQIVSPGNDGNRGTWDDIPLLNVVHVLSERSKDDEKPVIKNISFNTIYFGEITGVIGDQNGAAIPGVTVTATHNVTKRENSVTTNGDGRYLIVGLAAGSYTLRAESSGFKSTIIQNVPVTNGQSTKLDVVLEIGNVSAEVVVSSGAEQLMGTSSSSVSTTIESQQIASLPVQGRNTMSLLQLQPGAASGREDISTPRLREYFPETLLWRPELVTGPDGKAVLDFKMADNITTWKAYAIASTRDGKVGIAEKEIISFQSFFADLDPPKFLTDGDEISLPVQVRNYTDKKQTVDVTMDTAEWFSFLETGKRQIDVASGETQNAVFGFRAVRPVKDGKQRVTAMAQTESDAIEKPVTVKPDGNEVVSTSTEYFTNSARFQTVFPENAINGTPRSLIKIYPNLFANVTESVEGLLQRPYGCGEQTISSTYPNLMIVKFVDEDTPLKRRAMRNLLRGYERLLGYQAANGGFTYWGPSSEPDLALTAYAVRFLRDASFYMNVDQNVIARAQQWLLSKQAANGSWYIKHWNKNEENVRATKIMTTYIARTLTMPMSGGNADNKDGDQTGYVENESIRNGIKASIARSIAYLDQRSYELDEPYMLALLGLSAIESGDEKRANIIADRLVAMAKDEGTMSYWMLESNTPFNGWGNAGRIETTALAVQMLIKAKSTRPDKERIEKLLSRSIQFLLKNKDRYGVWYSTQTTVNVLDSLLAVINDSSFEKGTATQLNITVNGRQKETLNIDPDRIEPIEIDVTDKTTIGTNEVVISGSNGKPLMATLQNSHYVKWEYAAIDDRTVNASRAIELDVACDKTEVSIMETVSCKVRAERVGFQGYGMLLAEIGTPPGADVDRETLKEVMKNNWSISRYDVLPDRVVFYMWARAGGTTFDLKFKPRYGIKAQTPASIVYDYYNPDAQAVVRPTRFTVR